MLKIYLEPYGQTFFLTKDFIRSSLPQSLFTEALQDDPDVTEITITHPDVTPEAMEVISRYSQGIEPPLHVPNLILANRYLNIPWLLYYVDPLYDQIPNRTDINDMANELILEQAIRENHDWIVGYFMAKGWVPTLYNLVEGVKAHADAVIKVLMLNPEIDLTGDENELFRTAAEEGQTELVKRLLANPDVNPAAEKNEAIIEAAKNGHVEVVKLLLADKRVKPAAQNNSAIVWAAVMGHLDVMEILLANKKVNPGAHGNDAIIYAAENGKIEAVRRLLQDPRVNPAAQNNMAVRVAKLKRNTDIMNLLLADPRVDPAALNIPF